MPSSVITLATSLPALAYPDAPSIRRFYQRLLEQVESLPGVKASGGIDRPAALDSRAPSVHDRESAGERPSPSRK